MGERKAAEYLKKHGYRVRESNFRCRTGEIDIVALDGDCLVFVEVRTRTRSEFMSPEETIGPAKKRRILSAALTYLQTHRLLPAQWRIDVVVLEVEADHTISRIDLIRNAVQA